MTSHVAQADPVRGKWLLWRTCCNKETVPHWGSIVNPSAFSDLPSLPAPCKGPCCAEVQGVRPNPNPEHVLLLAPLPSPQFFLMPLIASALVLSFLSGAGVALAGCPGVRVPRGGGEWGPCLWSWRMVLDLCGGWGSCCRVGSREAPGRRDPGQSLCICVALGLGTMVTVLCASSRFLVCLWSPGSPLLAECYGLLPAGCQAWL